MIYKLILKSLIVLLFLFSRFTFYSDAYPMISSSDGIINNVVNFLKGSGDFFKQFPNIIHPHEKSKIEKFEDYILNIPALKSTIEEAKYIYQEKFKTHFIKEIIDRLFSKSTIFNFSHHISMRSLLYDTLMLSVLMYFIYRDHYFSNIVLIFDSIYKFITLLIYHFRDTPLDRISNYFISFFTNLKTTDISSMWKVNLQIISDHRSVLSTFLYLSLLIYYFLSQAKRNKIPKVAEEMIKHEPSRFASTETIRN